MPEKSESKSQLVSLWELVSGEKLDENPLTNIWELVSRCKTHAGYIRLFKQAKARQIMLMSFIVQALDGHPPHATTASAERIHAEELAAIYAIGFVNGLQQGRRLDSKSEGTVGPILKHAAVRRLLLRQPKASALEVCMALDKVEEKMPKGWKFRTECGGVWERAVKQPLVRVAITNARKAAIEEAICSEFLAVAKGVGEKGSILNKFRPKKYGLRP
jgi:hypothetical protein